MDNYSKKVEDGRFGAFSRVENANVAHATIPYYAHEAEVMRMEKHVHMLWVLIIVLFLTMVATNAAWLWYTNTNDIEEEEEEWECEGESDEEQGIIYASFDVRKRNSRGS